ncbi:DNA polymerase III subunit epsilon [Pelistega sp. NLN82]|uniref:DNA polymerase III subunit epsilon n=1 Tax=Pelistega ratti TaxID=2652177 RepID=A0A6L9Y3L8_9BURK|nr:DNA polymerase III subunit epsilon [Pelistega ratti]NEN74796.1 DNA polymerase III subunit epsilon [Pelistega ratti]
MMRQIVFDTETTGLKTEDGNRIIELGCVELIDRRLTGNNLHLYFNPQRDSEPDALKVHGLTTDFLSQYPTFDQQIQQIIEYIKGAEMIAHNAPFDIGFLNHEFALAGYPSIHQYVPKFLDTLVLAKELIPGVKRLSLDALCARFEIDNSHRELHGALLDSELLADVYIAMTRQQFGLSLEMHENNEKKADIVRQLDAATVNALPIIYANEEELSAHQAYVEALEKASGGTTLWTPSQHG